jgi:hypothetical protein
MKTEKFTANITFLEPTLATSPGNRDILEEFKTPKAPTPEKGAEELEAIPLEEQIEKASTVFPRDGIGLFCWDYQWRGFMKEQLATLVELGDAPAGINRWNLARAIDKFVFVVDRRNYYLREGQTIKAPEGNLQRPLRGKTLQGDRVCLARSEMINAGATLEITFEVLIPEAKPGAKKTLAVLTVDTIKECLKMGGRVGFSQWRSGGYGRFMWEQVGD